MGGCNPNQCQAVTQSNAKNLGCHVTRSDTPVNDYNILWCSDGKPNVEEVCHTHWIKTYGVRFLGLHKKIVVECRYAKVLVSTCTTLIYFLGWQCRICVCRLHFPKQQTFVSVANMSTMLARHVGNILLSRPFFQLSALCWWDLSPTHTPACT